MSVYDEMFAYRTGKLDEMYAGWKHWTPAEEPLFEVFKSPDAEGVYSVLVKSPGTGGDPWVHIVIGPDKAMVIDTAYGIGNLRAVVEGITDKPLIVVNTHFHGDHAMGNFQFDSAYVHEYDAPMLESERERKKDGAAYAPAPDAYYKASDVIPYKDYEIIPVKNGHVFDLGGRHEVELIHIPGHTPGGCAFLDRKNRILFSGDTIIYMPCYIFGGTRGAFEDFQTVTAFNAGLRALAARTGEFDSLYPGHNFLAVPAAIVGDMLALTEEIIADPNAAAVEKRDMGRGGEPASLGRHGLASVLYTKSRV